MPAFTTYDDAISSLDVKDVTKYIYCKRLRQLNRIIKGEDSDDGTGWISDPDGVLGVLSAKNLTKTATRNFITAVIALVKALNLPTNVYRSWQDVSKKLFREIAEDATNQKPTARDEAGWVEYDELVKLEAKLDRVVNAMTGKPLEIKDRITIYRYLILNLMVLSPPGRLELGNCRVISEQDETPETGNFIVRDGPRYEITIRDFKTSNKYGVVTFKYDLHVSRAIEKSLQLFPRTYLFSKLRDPESPLNNHGFGEFVTTHLYPGKSITTGILRKIFISDRFKNDTPEIERERVARQMMHTARASRLFYQKHREPQEATVVSKKKKKNGK